MKCIKQYITARFPKLGFVKELQGVYEFNEKLIINKMIKMFFIYFKISGGLSSK